MDGLVQKKIYDYVRQNYLYDDWQSATIVEKVSELARMSGSPDLDRSFAFAGLGAGPEASHASALTDLATMGGGCATSKYELKSQMDEWLRRTKVTRKWS